MSVLLETSLGDVVIDTFFEIVPQPCINFIKLCKIKYYNDCEFFRVQSGFVAQTGDPLNSGEGGSSIYSQCVPSGSRYIPKVSTVRLTHLKKGTVSFTAAAPAPNLENVPSPSDNQNAHGSQFFISLADNLEYLDEQHTIFGYVAEGMDVIDKLATIPVDDNFRPLRLIRIRHTIILDDPFDDPLGLPQNVQSPEPSQIVPSNRLPSDDDGDDGTIPTDADETAAQARLEQLKAEQDEREARSRAEVLEIIGDIGDADLKPPENVLFVCKLNSVTEGEDLEIIFSRFGKCSAEVIRDHETGESLCYAFVEFESKSQCEKAYFHMDSALIDDRRVRVDFSQSVSKLWNASRRRRTRNHKSTAQRVSSTAVPKDNSKSQTAFLPQGNVIKKRSVKDDLETHAGGRTKMKKSRFDERKK